MFIIFCFSWVYHDKMVSFLLKTENKIIWKMKMNKKRLSILHAPLSEKITKLTNYNTIALKTILWNSERFSNNFQRTMWNNGNYYTTVSRYGEQALRKMTDICDLLKVTTKSRISFQFHKIYLPKTFWKIVDLMLYSFKWW